MYRSWERASQRDKSGRGAVAPGRVTMAAPARRKTAINNAHLIWTAASALEDPKCEIVLRTHRFRSVHQHRAAIVASVYRVFRKQPRFRSFRSAKKDERFIANSMVYSLTTDRTPHLLNICVESREILAFNTLTEQDAATGRSDSSFEVTIIFSSGFSQPPPSNGTRSAGCDMYTASKHLVCTSGRQPRGGKARKYAE